MKPAKTSMRARVLAVCTASAIAVFGSLAVSSPAQAHSLTEAVQYGCGSSYTYVTGTLNPITSTTSSATYGYTGLARSSGSSYCLFAYKSASHEGHGVRTYMSACYATSTGASDCERGNFSHWVSKKFTLSSGSYVGYSALIYHPSPGYRAEGSGGHTRS